MEFKAAICPQCSANINNSEIDGFITCSHCKTKIFVDRSKATKEGAANFDVLMSLATSAESAGNFEEAYSFYTKALILNSTSPEAWRGKGYCAGLLSTLNNFRFNETINYFNQAIALAKPDEVDLLREQCAKQSLFIAQAFYATSRKHAHDFYTVYGVFTEHAIRCISVIELSEYAVLNLSDLPEIKEFICEVADKAGKANDLTKETKRKLAAIKYRYSNKPSDYSSSNDDMYLMKLGVFVFIIVVLGVNYQIAKNYFEIKNTIISLFASPFLFLGEIMIIGFIFSFYRKIKALFNPKKRSE